MTDPRFTVVGMRPAASAPAPKKTKTRGRRPVFAAALLLLILLGCIFAGLLTARDPAYMDLEHYSAPPSREFPFGTDSLGRDIFSMIWYGGRVSLLIGLLSAAISAGLAILFGALSGMAPAWLDALLMRCTEILLSVPNLLLVLFLQSILGEANVLSLSLVLGVTGWMSMAKVVRTEVRQLRSADFVTASKCMGGGFFHVLCAHLMPNFLPSILFMAVMNIRSAIVAESTLSFMGIGLPLEIISWGSMLSLAERAMMSGAWWIIVIPGAFLVVTLLCVTELANALRKSLSSRHSNL